MKLLFLTTYNLTIEREHIFTFNVWNGLCKQFASINDEISLATIVVDAQYTESTITEEECNGKRYYKLHYSSSLSEEKKVEEIVRFFKYIAPDIIHSNMVEAIDVKAAKVCDLPIVLTIHIGGFICPRGGVHGFLNYKDEICDDKVGPHCLNCCAQDLPLPIISNLLYCTIPDNLLSWAAGKVAGKQVFYLSQFLSSFRNVVQQHKKIENYKYATIIAANSRLKKLLALNGLTDNVVLLPHGVQSRPRLPFPTIDGVVKFYYVGRIQYAKGLHNMLRVFDGIDCSLYELHIIGDSSTSSRGRRYKAKLVNLAKNKNVVFHGEIPNMKLESVIKDMHVMIHPTICLEVYGISIAESLSIGRPVLATRCGGAEMQIQDGVNGWLVEPNNVTALRKKILGILNHREQLYEMSANCKLPHSLEEYAEGLSILYKRISIDKHVKDLIQVYEKEEIVN